MPALRERGVDVASAVLDEHGRRRCCGTLGGEPHTPACEATWRSTRNFPAGPAPGRDATVERLAAWLSEHLTWAAFRDLSDHDLAERIVDECGLTDSHHAVSQD